MERESMPFDVVIVGAGPAGLATAIRLKQLAPDREVCVLEKGSEIGAHILSGAVLESRALDELIPDWKDKGAPITTPVSEERFYFLTGSSGFGLPGLFLPPPMRNRGNHIISLGSLCRWLGEQAEALGVEIYPGFAATETLYDEDGGVKGVATGDMGIAKSGEPGPNYQPGIELHGRVTVFAEGCRGSLGKQLIAHFELAGDQPQTYGIGLKELWEIDPAKHRPGLIIHTAGWPLDSKTYGGSFLYHLEDNLVSVGFVVGLNYANPYLSPYEELQRFKTHPKARCVFEGGRRVAYGARALNEGGAQCLTKLAFPGGVLVGCEAGTLNMAKIKGTHTAMKSGMLAAEAIFEAFETGTDEEAGPLTLDGYAEAFRQSWAWDELYRARNVRPAFEWGLWGGTLYTGIDQLLLRGRAPWTLRHTHTDHAATRPAKNFKPIAYPKADGTLTFDRLTNVSFSATNHEENQPSHLKLADEAVPIATNLTTYAALEERYCPAGVYEIVDEDGEQRLQINAQNCLHCKTCDIKDPIQNITWTVPEGGGGPNYPNM